MVKVSSDTGKPTVSMTGPVHVTKTAFKDLTMGGGPAITSDAQDIDIDLTVISGTTGQPLVATSYNAGQVLNTVKTFAASFPGFMDALHCATEGSRVLMALPPSGISDEMRTNLHIDDTTSVVVVIDLNRVFLAAADGAPQYNDRAGMPSVVLAPNGQPGITVPQAAPPKGLAVELLKKGSGQKVSASDTVRVQYTGVLWDKRTVFDTTWGDSSKALALSSTVQGFQKALIGQRVGSQVMVVIPPELGYGAEGKGAVPANATLVFVVDILGIDNPAAQ